MSADTQDRHSVASRPSTRIAYRLAFGTAIGVFIPHLAFVLVALFDESDWYGSSLVFLSWYLISLPGFVYPLHGWLTMLLIACFWGGLGLAVAWRSAAANRAT